MSGAPSPEDMALDHFRGRPTVAAAAVNYAHGVEDERARAGAQEADLAAEVGRLRAIIETITDVLGCNPSDLGL